MVASGACALTCARAERMVPKAKTFAEVLEQSGMPIHLQAGGKAPDAVVDREVKKEPCPRAKKLRDLYFDTLSSASNEFPYWYTRKYVELEGEVPVVRR